MTKHYILYASSRWLGLSACSRGALAGSAHGPIVIDAFFVTDGIADIVRAHVHPDHRTDHRSANVMLQFASSALPVG